MLISEVIQGLQSVLDSQGNIPVCICHQNVDTKTIASTPVVTGGYGPFGASGALCAFLSTSDMDGVFTETTPTN